MKKDGKIAIVFFCALCVFVAAQTLRLTKSLERIDGMASGTIYRRAQNERVKAAPDSRQSDITQSRGKDSAAPSKKSGDTLCRAGFDSMFQTESVETPAIPDRVQVAEKEESAEPAMDTPVEKGAGDTAGAEDLSRILATKGEQDTQERDEKWIAEIVGLGQGSPRVGWSYYKKAVAARESGQLTRAASFYSRALEESRDILADSDYGLGSMILAELSQSLERTPGNIRILARMAYFNEAMGNLGKALEIYGELVQSVSDYRLRNHFADRLVALNNGSDFQAGTEIDQDSEAPETEQPEEEQLAQEDASDEPLPTVALTGKTGSEISGADEKKGTDQESDFMVLGKSTGVSQKELKGMLAQASSGASQSPAGSETADASPSGASEASEGSSDEAEYLKSLMASGNFVTVDSGEEAAAGTEKAVSPAPVSAVVTGSPAVLNERIAMKSSVEAVSGSSVSAMVGTGISRIPRKPVPAGPPSDFVFKLTGATLPGQQSGGVDFKTLAGGAVNDSSEKDVQQVSVASRQSSTIASPASPDFPLEPVKKTISETLVSTTANDSLMGEKAVTQDQMAALPSGFAMVMPSDEKKVEPLQTQVVEPVSTAPANQPSPQTDGGYRFLKIIDISRNSDVFVKGFKAKRLDGGRAIGALELNAQWKDSGLESIKAVCGALGFRREMTLGRDQNEIKYNGAEGYLYRIKVLEMDKEKARVAIEVRNGEAVRESSAT